MFTFRKKIDPPPPGDLAVAATAGPATDVTPPPDSRADEPRSWMDRLRTGLKKTGTGISGLFGASRVDEALFEALEDALLMADAGVEATGALMTELRARARRERIESGSVLKEALATLLVEMLSPLEKTLDLTRGAPIVMMVVGVNGAGKTTSIGKLARWFRDHDKSVLLAAGDTFRAAAREQLVIWGERNGVHVVAQESGDPAAVIFDAVGSARAKKIGVMLADTAGRLPTQAHLMEELKKIRRVIDKALPGAPHEVLLVIDGNTGQNALAQVKAFDDAVGLTGLIVTKLDGTAKGGVLAAIARSRPIPLYFVGVGETMEDLRPFRAQEFVTALLG